MEKEEQIKEMADYIFEARANKTSDELANGLYDMGYRKMNVMYAVDLIVKTALQELYDMCFELKDPESGSNEIKGCVTADDILWYAKEMDVEVDE